VPIIPRYDYQQAVIAEQEGNPPPAEGEYQQHTKKQFMKDLGLSDRDRARLRVFEQLCASEWFVEVKTLNAGKSFGELALINNTPRAATISSRSECYFAVVARADYQRVFKKMEWKEVQSKIDFFLGVPFISHWTRHQVNRLILSFTEQSFHRNQAVYQQGDAVNMVYIVKTGVFEQLRTRKSLKNTDMLNDTSSRNFLGKSLTNHKSRNGEK
jgi:hypothetical protein